MTRVIRTLIVLVALCALAAPVAHASYQSVIKDCAQDGRLDHKYSDAELIKAKKKLPSDLNEYSDCSDVIGAAIGGAGKHGGGGGGASGGGGGGGGGAGNTAPDGTSPGDPAAQQDKNDLNKIVQDGGSKPKVQVGDHTLSPGKNGLFSTASAENGLPLPLLLTLIAMAIVAMGGALYALRKRVPALAKIPLPRISLPRLVSFSRNRR